MDHLKSKDKRKQVLAAANAKKGNMRKPIKKDAPTKSDEFQSPSAKRFMQMKEPVQEREYREKNDMFDIRESESAAAFELDGSIGVDMKKLDWIQSESVKKLLEEEYRNYTLAKSKSLVMENVDHTMENVDHTMENVDHRRSGEQGSSLLLLNSMKTSSTPTTPRTSKTLTTHGKTDPIVLADKYLFDSEHGTRKSQHAIERNITYLKKNAREFDINPILMLAEKSNDPITQQLALAVSSLTLTVNSMNSDRKELLKLKVKDFKDVQKYVLVVRRIIEWEGKEGYVLPCGLRFLFGKFLDGCEFDEEDDDDDAMIEAECLSDNEDNRPDGSDDNGSNGSDDESDDGKKSENEKNHKIFPPYTFEKLIQTIMRTSIRSAYQKDKLVCLLTVVVNVTTENRRYIPVEDDFATYLRKAVCIGCGLNKKNVDNYDILCAFLEKKISESLNYNFGMLRKMLRAEMNDEEKFEDFCKKNLALLQELSSE